MEAKSTRDQVTAILDGLAADGLGVREGELPPSAEGGLTQAWKDHRPPDWGALIIDEEELYADPPNEWLLDDYGRPQPVELTAPQRAAFQRESQGLTPLVDAVLVCDGIEATQETLWVPAETLFVNGPDHAHALQQALQGLRTQLVLAVTSGEFETAWETAERMLALVRCARGPGLAYWDLQDQLVKEACTAVCGLLSYADPGAARRARLLEQLQALEDPKALQDALRWELHKLLAISQGLVEGHPEGEAFFQQQVIDPKVRGTISAGALIKPDLLFADRIALVDLHARLLRACEGPAQVIKEARALGPELDGKPMTHVVTGVWGRSDRVILPEYPAQVARLRLARAALTLVAEAQGGELPAALPQVFIDPLSPDGKPIRWRRDEAGKGLLYTVGLDGDYEPDQGAEPDPERDYRQWVRVEVWLPGR